MIERFYKHHPAATSSWAKFIFIVLAFGFITRYFVVYSQTSRIEQYIASSEAYRTFSFQFSVRESDLLPPGMTTSIQVPERDINNDTITHLTAQWRLQHDQPEVNLRLPQAHLPVMGEEKQVLSDSDFMIGVAPSTDERWEERLKVWAEWVPKHVDFVVAISPMTTAKRAQELTESLQAAGLVNARVILSTEEEFYHRYLQLTVDMLNIRRTSKKRMPKWLLYIDDDTVFYWENLVSRLARYDSSKAFYIGTELESFANRHADNVRLAWGGAGTALSFPAAERVAQIVPECLRKYTKNDQVFVWGSDYLLGLCANVELGIPFTVDWGLHQVEYRGNVAGMWESGQRGLASYHHALNDSWVTLFEGRSASEAFFLSLKSFRHLKDRWLTRAAWEIRSNDWQGLDPSNSPRTVLFTIGYSIVIFNRKITVEDLHKIECTFDPRDGDCFSVYFQGRKGRLPDSEIRYLLHSSDEKLYKGGKVVEQRYVGPRGEVIDALIYL